MILKKVSLLFLVVAMVVCGEKPGNPKLPQAPNPEFALCAHASRTLQLDRRGLEILGFEVPDQERIIV